MASPHQSSTRPMQPCLLSALASALSPPSMAQSVTWAVPMAVKLQLLPLSPYLLALLVVSASLRGKAWDLAWPPLCLL